MKKIILSGMLLTLLFAFTQEGEKTWTPILVEAKRWVKGDNNQPWQFYETRIIDNLSGYNKETQDPENTYGSHAGKKTTATGFFRTEKKDGRWWMVDPLGNYHIERAINSFRKGTSERNQQIFDARFGTDMEWIRKAAEEFADIRINTIGSWSADSLIRAYNTTSPEKRLGYCVNLRLMALYGKKRGGTYQLAGNIGFPNQTIFVFDPEFRVFCDSVVKQDVSILVNDPDLVGYFSDNELPFTQDNLEGYLSLPHPEDPGRQAAEAWLKEKGVDRNKITDRERSEFAGYVADRYFQVVSSAIKKTDPNHMYLGSRIHGRSKFIPEVMQAAGKYCDVVSINYYGVWTPESMHLNNWKEWFDKPFIITEFYTKSMDTGMANTTGAGYTVHTQKDRGHAYQDFCLALLESKQCVGWHYFKYQDNDPTAKGVDPSNIDSNKGIVNNEYVFYEELTKAMKQLNQQVYSLIEYFDN